MNQRRTYEEHVALFVVFANRVAGLRADAWTRLDGRCAELNGSSFSALLERASVSAKSYEPWLPKAAERHLPLRIIAGTTHVVAAGLAILGELATEFESAGPAAPLASPRRRTRSSGNPRIDAFIDANYLIESALAPRERGQPGVAAVVRAAGRAVLRHDWIPLEAFTTLYGPVEPEIPFASLESTR